MVMVSVLPVMGGWSVVHDLDSTPLMFLSGGKAEAKAKQLAELVRRGGGAAQLKIFTRDGRLAFVAS